MNPLTAAIGLALLSFGAGVVIGRLVTLDQMERKIWGNENSINSYFSNKNKGYTCPICEYIFFPDRLNERACPNCGVPCEDNSTRID